METVGDITASMPQPLPFNVYQKPSKELNEKFGSNP
jgi:hypothetical protein